MVARRWPRAAVPPRSAGRPGWTLSGRLLVVSVILALVGPPLALAGSPPARAAAGPGVVETAYGPLGSADRDLLIRVRLAGLWEIPAGELAQERGTTEEIRQIGQFIAEEHTELDARVREVAEALGVALPDQPHPDHQVFLQRLRDRTGEEFDRAFIQLLREAHGQIYPLIAYVRAGTQNDLIRQFTDACEEFVARHMAYLESSGLVDWLHIPPPPEPAGTPSRFLASAPAGVNPTLIWLLLAVAAVTGTVTTIRTIRPR